MGLQDQLLSCDAIFHNNSLQGFADIHDKQQKKGNSMHLSSPERILHRFCWAPPSCPHVFSLEGAHTKVRGEGGNCNSEPIFAVRITPFMFNSRFRIPKRQLQSKPASCIAFWFIATPKAVHLLPESLQRF